MEKLKSTKKSRNFIQRFFVDFRKKRKSLFWFLIAIFIAIILSIFAVIIFIISLAYYKNKSIEKVYTVSDPEIQKWITKKF